MMLLKWLKKEVIKGMSAGLCAWLWGLDVTSFSDLAAKLIVDECTSLCR